MASAVDICNLALGHLGDRATVASLDPPEGSAQAEHCARFYPLARDTLLEMHAWNFATKRATLAQLNSTVEAWAYSYATPTDAIKLLYVLPSYTTTDNELVYNSDSTYIPHPFVREVNETGADVVYTNVEDAVLRYIARVTDTTRFSPLFVQTLSWHLASMLAGPIIKGDQGAAEAKRCAAMMQQWLGQAKASNANQGRNRVDHSVSWMAHR